MTGKYFHLAGVISLLGDAHKFGMEWPDYMAPIATDFTMVENSVLACAVAGCETIWITCNDDTIPLLRYRLGDWIEDPVYINRKSTQHYNYRKGVPIFYVPTHPDDMGRRDSEAWGILSSAVTAQTVSGQISKWTRPSAYFVSFPRGLYDLDVLRKNRNMISSKKPFCLVDAKSSGKSFINGERLGFTFGAEKLALLVKHFKENNVNMFKDGKKLLKEESYTGRYFSLEKTFKCLNIEDYYVKRTQFYHNIGDWDSYRNYIGSEDSGRFTRPHGSILKFREFSRIPGENK